MNNLSERNIESGDRVYVINEVEKCALTTTGINDESYNLELVTTKSLNNGSVWRFNIKEHKKRIGFQLIVEDNVAKKGDTYLAYGYRSNIEKYKAGHLISRDKEDYNVFFAQDKNGNNVKTSDLKYGVPYRIHNLKFFEEGRSDATNIYLGIDKTSTMTRASLPGYSKSLLYWIFLPSVPDGDISPECAYVDYITGSGRCSESRINIYDRCSSQLNDYCSYKELGESNVCTQYMRLNPGGKADDVIREVCEQGTNFRDPLCSCVGPIKFQRFASLVPGKYEQEWYCNADVCKSNRNRAFKLSIQDESCPKTSKCFYTETLSNGAIVLKRDLDCQEDDDDNNNRDRDNNTGGDRNDETEENEEKRRREAQERQRRRNIYIGLGIVGLILGGGILIWYFTRDEPIPRTSTYQRTVYSENTPYTPYIPQNTNIPYSRQSLITPFYTR